MCLCIKTNLCYIYIHNTSLENEALPYFEIWKIFSCILTSRLSEHEIEKFCSREIVIHLSSYLYIKDKLY